MLNDIKKLEPGKQQEIKLLVKSVQSATTRTGDVYQKVIVRDEYEHEATFVNFKDAIQTNLPVVITATIDTSEGKEVAFSRVLSFQVNEGEDPNKYLPKPRINAKETVKFLVNKNKEIRSSLRKIVAEILNEHIKTFISYPFSQSGSFSRTAGILEATYKLTMLAEQTAVVMGLDKDMMLAGAMLYYIGKTQTMDISYQTTPDDVLLGVGLSSAMIVQNAVQKIRAAEQQEQNQKNSKNDEKQQAKDKHPKDEIREEEVKLLMHILTSRFKGVQTAIPEACALRYLDAIVTDTESIREIQKSEQGGSIVCDKNHFGNKIYCPTSA